MALSHEGRKGARTTGAKAPRAKTGSVQVRLTLQSPAGKAHGRCCSRKRDHRLRI